MPVARARTSRVSRELSWVSHVYTAPAARRRGVATALMARILTDTQQADYERSALLSTDAGRGVYSQLGYREIATVLHFTAKQR